VTRRGQHRDEQAGQGHARLEDESELREVVPRAEGGVRDEEGEAGAEQAGEQDLAHEPALFFLDAVGFHLPLVGRRLPADKRQVCRPGS